MADFKIKNLMQNVEKKVGDIVEKVGKKETSGSSGGEGFQDLPEFLELVEALRRRDRDVLFSSGDIFSPLARKGQQLLAGEISWDAEVMRFSADTARHVVAHLWIKAFPEEGQWGFVATFKDADPFRYCQWHWISGNSLSEIPNPVRHAAGMDVDRGRFTCYACQEAPCLGLPGLVGRSLSFAPYCRLMERKAADLLRGLGENGKPSAAFADWLIGGFPGAPGSMHSIVREMFCGPNEVNVPFRLRAVDGLVAGTMELLPFLRGRTDGYWQVEFERPADFDLAEYAVAVYERLAAGLCACLDVARYSVGDPDDSAWMAGDLAEEMWMTLFILAAAHKAGRRTVVGANPEFQRLFEPLLRGDLEWLASSRQVLQQSGSSVSAAKK